MTKKSANRQSLIRKILREFKTFVNRGNVVDLAVGIVIGTAFGRITTSLVSDILMPIIGAMIGNINFASLSFKIGTVQIMYGSFIKNVVDFFLIAIGVFVFVRIFNRLSGRLKSEQSQTEAVVKKEDEQIEILKEIRDNLKK